MYAASAHLALPEPAPRAQPGDDPRGIPGDDGRPMGRLQQFITSSIWDYAEVRRNVARWFAASFPVEALVVDDTGFAKDGDASPSVARQYSGTLGKTRTARSG
jgi:hypothetical protein